MPLRYFVRCARCDRAFWLEERDAAVPEHSRWNRRATGPPSPPESPTRCDGSNRPGYWIGEGDGPIEAP